MSRVVLAGLVWCLAAAGEPAAAPGDAPPSFFVDRDACPFECCQYGEWTVTRTTEGYAGPDARSKRVATFRVGARVTAVTGEVHTRPSKFVVEKARAPYNPGDVLWVYTYTGEGHFAVWFQGEMFTEDLGVSPYGGTYGTRCAHPDCWGRLDRELRSTWWVKRRGADGGIAWTNRPQNFSGRDACG